MQTRLFPLGGAWGLFSHLLRHHQQNNFLVPHPPRLHLIGRVPSSSMSLPLPSTVIGSSSGPQTHLTLRLNATRSIQSLQSRSSLHVVLSSSLLCTSLSRSGQSEPRPFTSAPTSFFPFPLLPFHYFIYFLSVHLAGLSQEMASCPRCGIKALLVSWLTL